MTGRSIREIAHLRAECADFEAVLKNPDCCLAVGPCALTAWQLRGYCRISQLSLQVEVMEMPLRR
jgi:hypothetical protein